ncbi:MAG: hypothetical protein Q8J69_04095 [Sphingobacteriaceae bacterium]|nr:hypothetical protein [Sphingobacteriaceae bacterium]
MEKFNFDLDSKISLNRQRIREQFEQYKRIENYYAFFFAYVAMLGTGIFEIIILAINSATSASFFQFSAIILVLVVLMTFYFFCQLIWLKGIHVDPIPKNVYSQFNQNEEISEQKKLEDEIKIAYLTLLEDAIEFNQEVYSRKKAIVADMLKSIIFVFLLYTPLLTYTKMAENENDYAPLENIEQGKSVIHKSPTIQNESRTDSNHDYPITQEVVHDRLHENSGKK